MCRKNLRAPFSRTFFMLHAENWFRKDLTCVWDKPNRSSGYLEVWDSSNGSLGYTKCKFGINRMQVWDNPHWRWVPRTNIRKFQKLCWASNIQKVHEKGSRTFFRHKINLFLEAVLCIPCKMSLWKRCCNLIKEHLDCSLTQGYVYLIFLILLPCMWLHREAYM